MSMAADVATILSAFASNDSFEIRQALRTPGVWLFGALFTLIGGVAVFAIYRAVPLIERHLERTVMVASYLVIAAIIFVEVFRRFILSEQAPWSTTLPPFLFLVMTWFGCAYNVKLRTHLSFSEFRMNMPRGGQMACLILDAVLWLGFCWIVIVTASRVAANSAANFQILLGTDNVLQWWFLVTVPFAFLLMAGRVIENLVIDLKRFKSDEPLIRQAVIGGD